MKEMKLISDINLSSANKNLLTSSFIINHRIYYEKYFSKKSIFFHIIYSDQQFDYDRRSKFRLQIEQLDLTIGPLVLFFISLKFKFTISLLHLPQ